LEKVPTIVLHLNAEQRKAFSIADNKTAEIADWDFPKLRGLIKEIQNEDLNLQDLGFSDSELRRILLQQGTDENEIPKNFSDFKTKKGDLWILGPHKLFCGDSRDKRAIGRLFEGEKAHHVFGGPPFFNLRSYSQWGSFQDYMEDMRKILLNCHDVLENGGVIVWDIGNLSTKNLDLTSHHSIILEECGFQYFDTIIWVKTGPNFSVFRNAHIVRNRIYYPTFQWEALLVFRKPGPMVKMTREGAKYMSDFQSNVWEIPSVLNRQKKHGHPDVCPVEIPYRCIQAYTVNDSIIFEPFGGSGTTLIAAEKAKKTALVMECNPVFCGIILKRWADLTGKKPKKQEKEKFLGF